QADLALVSADLERAAGGDTRGSARRAVELAEACDDPERLLAALAAHARALGDAGEVGLAARVLERAQKVEDELTARVPDESLATWAERSQRAELRRLADSLASAWTRTRHESVPPPRVLASSQAAVPRDRDARAAPRQAKTTEWARKYPGLVGGAHTL